MHKPIIEITTEPDLGLMHHLVQGSLMPWLEENNDPMLFRILKERREKEIPGNALYYLLNQRPFGAEKEVKEALQRLFAGNKEDKFNELFHQIKPIAESPDKLFFYLVLSIMALHSGASNLIYQFHHLGEEEKVLFLKKTVRTLQEFFNGCIDKSIERTETDRTILFVLANFIVILYSLLEKHLNEHLEKIPLRLSARGFLRPSGDENNRAMQTEIQRIVNQFIQKHYRAIKYGYEENAHEAPVVRDDLPVQKKSAADANNKLSRSEEGEKVFLSTKEAAKLCNVSPKTIVDWCKAGRVKHEHIGKSYKIYKKALELMIKTQQTN